MITQNYDLRFYIADVTYKMIRNPDPEASPNTIFEGEPYDHPWENFKPAPVKKGSLVLLDGKVNINRMHLSFLIPTYHPHLCLYRSPFVHVQLTLST